MIGSVAPTPSPPSTYLRNRDTCTTSETFAKAGGSCNWYACVPICFTIHNGPIKGGLNFLLDVIGKFYVESSTSSPTQNSIGI